MKRALFFSYILIFSLLGSCEKENNEKPTLSTLEVTQIKSTTALLGGEITTDGGSAIKARGLVWDTLEYPTVNLNLNMSNEGNEIGSFSTNIFGLKPNTTYYVRAYATNKAGTQYGNQRIFTTLSGEIKLFTSSAYDITTKSAKCGYSVLSDGGEDVISQGIVWSTSPSPTTSNFLGKTDESGGIGSFVASITNLDPYTMYYFRAYAINSSGTYYGLQESFSTKGIVTYNDYNYTTVTINGKEWFAENLQTTLYNDGTSIHLEIDNFNWLDNKIPSYCWYDNNYETNGSVYGALYNWYAVNTGKLCPQGWHVSTNADLTDLLNYIRAENQNTYALMSKTGWRTNRSTDIYGFSALPGGYRSDHNGTFGGKGYSSAWWSSTQRTDSDFYADYAYYLFLNEGTITEATFIKQKWFGYSVRCIKD